MLSPLADDGDGTTYVARALTAEREYVALKLYRPRTDTDAILSRYAEWKPALDRLQHPRVCVPQEVGVTADGCVFTVRRYVAGRPLSRFIAEEPAGADSRARLGHQIGEAVEAVRAAGLAHLRLAPERVIVSYLDAYIIGLGSGLVIDGANLTYDADTAAVARLTRLLTG